MKVICITGTPGTGKTSLSKELSKRPNYLYLDANKIISKYNLTEGYDRKRKTKIIDVKKLNKKIIDEISSMKNHPLKHRNLKNKKIKGITIDSHLSHYLPRKYVDFCIVTKCGISELARRLKAKKFHKSKILENLQAEIFDICRNEAAERKHKIITVDTTKGFNINEVIRKTGG